MPGYRIIIAIVILLSYFFLPVFVSDSAAGYGEFLDSTQSLGNSQSYAVALGDVDGDGDLDAFVANGNNQPNRVWLFNFCGCDIDENSFVDGLDLTVFAGEYGRSNCSR